MAALSQFPLNAIPLFASTLTTSSIARRSFLFFLMFSPAYYWEICSCVHCSLMDFGELVISENFPFAPYCILPVFEWNTNQWPPGRRGATCKHKTVSAVSTILSNRVASPRKVHLPLWVIRSLFVIDGILGLSWRVAFLLFFASWIIFFISSSVAFFCLRFEVKWLNRGKKYACTWFVFAKNCNLNHVFLQDLRHCTSAQLHLHLVHDAFSKNLWYWTLWKFRPTEATPNLMVSPPTLKDLYKFKYPSLAIIISGSRMVHPSITILFSKGIFCVKARLTADILWDEAGYTRASFHWQFLMWKILFAGV